MSVLRHWHAVLPARQLRRRPVPVTLAGKQWVVFRAGDGPAMLRDRCPHRGMPLSAGRVVDGRLRCAFHGWRYGADGTGQPLTEGTAPVCTPSLEVVEQQGLVWAREPGHQGPPPHLETDGYRSLGTFRMEVETPLEVLVDSFAEIEHTGFVHFLGFDPERWAEVSLEVMLASDEVRVHCSGPQRRLMRWGTRWLGVPGGARYHVDWQTRFSPLCTRYDHSWQKGGQVHPEQVRAYLFFQPTTPGRSAVVTSAWTSARDRGRLGLNRLLRPLHARFVQLELERDRGLLARMPADAADLSTAHLGAGDRALVATRRRLEELYLS